MLGGACKGPPSAQQFLEARALHIPADASEIRYEQADSLRAIAHFVRLSVSPESDRGLKRSLPCQPSALEAPPADGPGYKPTWFEVTGLRALESCDTNGPYDGRFHLEVQAGTADDGRVRLLLSFSD
jgi:hypothetical protein